MILINDTEGNFFSSIDVHNIMLLERIKYYALMILVPTGLVLNTLSFVVFYKIKRHKSAVGCHIMCMAVADNCVLLGAFAVEADILGSSLQDRSWFLCKGSTVLVNSGCLWSGLLLASATIERFCCIAYPLKVKTWNLVTVSKILNVVFFFTSFGFNIPTVFGTYIETYENKTTCAFNEESTISKVTDLIVNGIVSNMVIMLLILIFTIAIAVRLHRIRNHRRTLSQNLVLRSNKEVVITSMLFAIACLFLATRLPITVIYEVGRYLDLAKNSENFQLYYTVWPVSVILLVINYSVNFVIYVIFFKEFRDKLLNSGRREGFLEQDTFRRSSTRISVLTVNRTVAPAPQIVTAF